MEVKKITQEELDNITKLQTEIAQLLQDIGVNEAEKHAMLHKIAGVNVKQEDLKEIFGSQGNVSGVLNGKREITLKHIQKLAEQFHVPPSI